MDDAIALGFYARHPLIMDSLHDAEDFDENFDSYARENELPEELIKIIADNVDVLNSLFSRVDEERLQFESDLRSKLLEQASIGTKVLGTRLVPWRGTIRLRPRDGKMTRARTVEIGWSWLTSDDSLHIDPWVWMAGGRKTEGLIMRFLGEHGGADKAEMARDIDDYHIGTVRLDKIDVLSFVSDEFCLDVKKLEGAVLSSFSWVSAQTLTDLFKRSRDL